MAGKQQPRDRGGRIGEAADRVDQIVAGQPLVAADVMRMDEDRRAARRCQFPERVEIGVVEIAAGALRLRRDHRAVKAGIERLFEDCCGQRAVLQRHCRQRRQRRQRGGVLGHVLVVEARPVGRLLALQLVAVDIGPAADELMIDARLLQPVAPRCEIVKARLDRPSRRAAGERHARRAAFLVQPHRREQPGLAAQRVEHRARHDMGMRVDDHRAVSPMKDPIKATLRRVAPEGETGGLDFRSGSRRLYRRITPQRRTEGPMPAPSPSPGRPRRSVLYPPRLEPARARQGADPAGGRADLRPRGRGRAGGQGGGARQCRCGAERRRLRAARAGPAGQRARHGLGACRYCRCRDLADRRRAAAEGRERGSGAARGLPSRRARRAARAVGVVHGRNPARGFASGRDRRREPPSRGAGARHLGSDKGFERARDPRPAAADDRARPRAARGARVWMRGARRGAARPRPTRRG